MYVPFKVGRMGYEKFYFGKSWEIMLHWVGIKNRTFLKLPVSVAKG